MTPQELQSRRAARGMSDPLNRLRAHVARAIASGSPVITEIRAVNDSDIPDLPHGCGSWIVTRNATGEVVCEVFADRKARLYDFRADSVTIRTAADHLASLNRRGV